MAPAIEISNRPSYNGIKEDTDSCGCLLWTAAFFLATSLQPFSIKLFTRTSGGFHEYSAS